MLPQLPMTALLGLIQADIDTIHCLERRLATKRQELLDLEAALPILGQTVVQNHDLIKAAEDVLVPLTKFSSCLSYAINTTPPTAMGPDALNAMLRMHSLPVLADYSGIHGAEDQTSLQISMLRNVISESQKIQSTAAIALETAHSLLPTTKSAIQRLERVTMDVGEDIKFKHRLAHPVHRLPCELMVQILRLAVQIEKEEQEASFLTRFKEPDVKPSCILISITAVCRTWRANLQNDHLLWKSHLINGSTVTGTANSGGTNPDVLLIVDSGSASFDRDLYLSKLLLPPQMVHITFKSNARLKILPFCPPSLHLYNRLRFDGANLDQRFSSLRSLSCTDILPAISDRLLSLVELKIRFRDKPSPGSLLLNTFAQTLANIPNITTLDVCCPMPEVGIDDQSIVLASLTTLKLRLTFPKCILTCFSTPIRCPKLTDIEVSLPVLGGPAEKVEELLKVGQVRSQLTTLRILGSDPPQVEFSQFPPLTSLKTLVVEGSCARTFLEGILCTQLLSEHPLICPVLSHVCIRESTIAGGTIKKVIQSYRNQRALGEGGILPKTIVEVHDCPNVSVTEMRDFRRMRE
jgi:hypothetical protein